VDINELKGKFQENMIPLNPEITDDLASILLCFGCIDVERCWGERVPPETPEEETARKNLENREEKLQKLLADKEKDAKAKKQINKEEEKKRNEEEASLIEAIAKFKAQLKPKKPQKQKLSLTSLHDLLQSVDKMAEYDRILSELGVIHFQDYD
jgi:beta-phosphoglucomutase-like phosphatase (HAD superfamily)